MGNQIFIPTVAEYAGDISTSLGIQEPLINRGYNPGLMLVIRNGREGVILDSAVDKQYSNLKQTTGERDVPIVTMLSNMPISEMDFLHNPLYSAEHVKRGIDFTKNLPYNSRKVVTFHLNSLVSKEEFKEKDETGWKNEFYRIMYPMIKEVSKYAKNRGVEVKIETVPVPEFGDISSSDKRTYRGVKLNHLRNPFYLSNVWGFEQMRDAGLGVCLDLSHNRTLYEMAKKQDPDGALHKGDIKKLNEKTLFDDVKMLEHEDICHLSDGKGLYSEAERTVHAEGVALGKGDIKNLEKMIDYLNEKGIDHILEINETDFKNRPNTKESINYILNNTSPIRERSEIYTGDKRKLAEEKVVYYESPTYAIARSLKEKGYNIADCLGMKQSEPDHYAIGILKPRESTQKSFLGFTWRQRDLYLGTLWLDNKVRGAKEREMWVLEANGREHIPQLTKLAEEIYQKNNVKIKLELLTEDQRFERYSVRE